MTINATCNIVYLLFAWQVRDCSPAICCSCFSWSNLVFAPSLVNIPAKACEHLAFSRPRHRDIIWFQVAFLLNGVSKWKKGHSIQPPCVEQKCNICIIYFHTWGAKRGKVNVLLYCGCVEILEQRKTTEQPVPSHHNISKIASEIPCLIAGPW